METVVPIRPLLEQEKISFSPDEIRALVDAFEGALRTLKLTDRSNPATLMVAKSIIELARSGTHDPTILRDAIVKAFSK